MEKIISFCLIAIVALASSQPSTVFGCALNPGDPWFTVTPEITSNPLSKQLGITFSPNASLVTFTNKGLTSDLYIASKDTNGKYPGYRDPQKSYRPAEEIIGHDFDPNVLVSVGERLPRGIYTFRGGWDKTTLNGSTEDSGTVVLDVALDSTDNYKTKQIVGDGRPSRTTIPSPDHQVMYAFYQGKRYDIKLILHYALNRDYDSFRTRNSCSNEVGSTQGKKRSTDWPISSALVGLALLVLVFLVGSRLRKRRNKKPSSKNRHKK